MTRVVVLVAAMFVTTGLQAQNTPAPPPSPLGKPAPGTGSQAPTPAPKPAPSAAVEMTFERTPNLTPAERNKRTTRALSQMRILLSRGIELSATARREKDVVRLNCIKEKVTAMKALLRVAEQAAVSLQEATSSNQKDTADYEYQRIQMAQTKAQQMSAEANSCVGEVAVYTGPVQVVVDIDPEVPPRDPTIVLEPPTRIDQFPGILDRPQALSPPM